MDVSVWCYIDRKAAVCHMGISAPTCECILFSTTAIFFIHKQIGFVFPLYKHSFIHFIHSFYHTVHFITLEKATLPVFFYISCRSKFEQRKNQGNKSIKKYLQKFWLKEGSWINSVITRSTNVHSHRYRTFFYRAQLKSSDSSPR